LQVAEAIKAIEIAACRDLDVIQSWPSIVFITLS
jgi:hypothetical protein